METKTNLKPKATLLIETVRDNERLAKMIQEDKDLKKKVTEKVKNSSKTLLTEG